MSHRFRGDCSSPNFRRSHIIEEEDGLLNSISLYEGGSLGQELSSEDQAIIYKNAMMLMNALDLARPFYEGIETEGAIEAMSVVKKYSAEVFLNRQTGEIAYVDYDGSFEIDTLEKQNLAHLMFMTDYETEIDDNGDKGQFTSKFRFESVYTDPARPEYWVSVPEERAATNLQMTLNMLDEQ